MNYRDFEKIEQDEWSLTRPTFPTPKGGTLTVVGWSGRKTGGFNKYYVVECSFCKKDKELNGDAVYRGFKNDLAKGSIPCGCSKHPLLSKQQRELIISRICAERGIELVSFVGGFKGSRTQLKLLCPEHGAWVTTIKDFSSRPCGCPACGISRKGKPADPEDHVRDFFATGSFHKGTKFWRSDKKTAQGSLGYWFYKCPVCSKDEYVKAGLCDGIFETFHGSLKEGRLACRCSKSPVYTEDQWTYRIEKESDKRGYTFIGWLEKPGGHRRFQYSCPLHGTQETWATSYLVGQGCPVCGGQDQRQCYINQVSDGDSPVAIKFGISRSSNLRVRIQNSTNLFRMEQIGVWEFPSVKSCKAAEKQCKKELECRVLTKRELKDGYTETTHIKNLDRIIEIYENHGGKRINTNEER